MTRIDWLCLTLIALFASACAASDDSISGVRADGLVVNCAPTGDDVYACDPEDFDDSEEFDDDDGSYDDSEPDEPGDTQSDPDDPGDPETCEDWEEGGSIYVLWPPNHSIYTFTLDDCASIQDECDVAIAAAADGRITAVTSDEADNGTGDGNTKGDIRIVDETTVEVRSERKGNGDGRVYRIEYETEAGESGSCEIHVPHNRGPFGGAVDSGEAARVDSPS